MCSAVCLLHSPQFDCGLFWCLQHFPLFQCLNIPKQIFSIKCAVYCTLLNLIGAYSDQMFDCSPPSEAPDGNCWTKIEMGIIALHWFTSHCIALHSIIQRDHGPKLETGKVAFIVQCSIAPPDFLPKLQHFLKYSHCHQITVHDIIFLHWLQFNYYTALH